MNKRNFTGEFKRFCRKLHPYRPDASLIPGRFTVCAADGVKPVLFGLTYEEGRRIADRRLDYKLVPEVAWPVGLAA